MGFWLANSSAHDVTIKIWSANNTQADFTLRYSQQGAPPVLAAPIATTFDSAIYVLDPLTKFMDLVASGFYAPPGASIPIYGLATQGANNLPFYDIGGSPPINGPPFVQIKLGSVTAGEHNILTFDVLGLPLAKAAA